MGEHSQYLFHIYLQRILIEQHDYDLNCGAFDDSLELTIGRLPFIRARQNKPNKMVYTIRELTGRALGSTGCYGSRRLTDNCYFSLCFTGLWFYILYPVRRGHGAELQTV